MTEAFVYYGKRVTGVMGKSQCPAVSFFFSTSYLHLVGIPSISFWTMGVRVGDDAQEEGYMCGVIGQGKQEGHVDSEHGH